MNATYLIPSIAHWGEPPRYIEICRELDETTGFFKAYGHHRIGPAILDGIVKSNNGERSEVDFLRGHFVGDDILYQSIITVPNDSHESFKRDLIDAGYLFKAPAIIEQPKPVEDSSPRSYKDFAKKSIGGSDIASLLFRPCYGDPFVVGFGEDGEYSAYICECDNVVIGDHYRKVGEGAGWLRIYDDDGLSFESRSDFPKFTIYRAGMMGCIIHFHSKEEDED